jgi:hypothetical protein
MVWLLYNIIASIEISFFCFCAVIVAVNENIYLL